MKIFFKSWAEQNGTNDFVSVFMVDEIVLGYWRLDFDVILMWSDNKHKCFTLSSVNKHFRGSAYIETLWAQLSAEVLHLFLYFTICQDTPMCEYKDLEQPQVFFPVKSLFLSRNATNTRMKSSPLWIHRYPPGHRNWLRLCMCTWLTMADRAACIKHTNEITQ